jgi:hypothetical protein
MWLLDTGPFTTANGWRLSDERSKAKRDRYGRVTSRTRAEYLLYIARRKAKG